MLHSPLLIRISSSKLAQRSSLWIALVHKQTVSVVNHILLSHNSNTHIYIRSILGSKWTSLSFKKEITVGNEKHITNAILSFSLFLGTALCVMARRVTLVAVLPSWSWTFVGKMTFFTAGVADPLPYHTLSYVVFIAGFTSFYTWFLVLLVTTFTLLFVTSIYLSHILSTFFSLFLTMFILF